MKNKHIGLLIVAIGILLLALMISLIPVIQNAEASDCGCSSGDTCEYANRLPFQFYIGFGIIFILFYVSYVIISKDKPTKTKITLPDNLDSEEKKIMDSIIKADGMIFQSELVEKLGLNKVKVTRLLDKLEGKNLIERRRRGMTNAIILKNKD